MPSRVAAALIAHRRVNTLVLVHRKELLKQWLERRSPVNFPEGRIRVFAGNTAPMESIVHDLVRGDVEFDRTKRPDDWQRFRAASTAGASLAVESGRIRLYNTNLYHMKPPVG